MNFLGRLLFIECDLFEILYFVLQLLIHMKVERQLVSPWYVRVKKWRLGRFGLKFEYYKTVNKALARFQLLSFIFEWWYVLWFTLANSLIYLWLLFACSLKGILVALTACLLPLGCLLGWFYPLMSFWLSWSYPWNALWLCFRYSMIALVNSLFKVK